MKSVLNVQVSCFKNYRESKNPKSVNLLTWLSSEKYRSQVEEIRGIHEKAKRDELKATLPAMTPSGLFSKRCESGIIDHSGLIQIDLDRQDNLHIVNWDDLKSELIKLPEIAYLGKSVSGTGYWGLIPIPPDISKHKLYFDAIQETFQNWGIELDQKPKSVASLRGYSFDEDAYFNHKASLFNRPKEIIIKPVRTSFPAEPSILLTWLIEKMNSAVPGDRHSTRLKVGRLLGGYIASGVLPYGSEEQLIQNYLSYFGSADSISTQKKEIKAIKMGVSDGVKYPIT
ncbi:hypothetical protein JYB62_11950 [Algoriphagus lutimaris]|uniref:BT4734/BF3469 family protein n=1 Tax=Algoriphagus lutimaris TaxID=613197 RepID=UPI00196AFEC8|nr:BT4734/BF3469 family protein [Algoriphagus lutimaris]MBN3520712.1 hypothetical protein [Algoriphagus lutimaris]